MASQHPRAIVADDHAIVRDGLKELLAELEIVVVAEAANGLEAIAEVKVHAPDLVLLDVIMPMLGGLEAVPEILRWSPSTRVVLFTGVDSGISTSRLLQLPVHGLFLKGDPIEVLQASIPRILAGERVVSPSIPASAAPEAVDTLTKRELQILGHLLRGQTNRAIADRLNVSVHTVNNHRANLMAKLDVHSVAELITYAAEHGLLELTRDRGPG